MKASRNEALGCLHQTSIKPPSNLHQTSIKINLNFLHYNYGKT